MHDRKWYLGSGTILLKAIEKYGKENFSKEILENCYSEEELNLKEIFWIKEFNSRDSTIGYNICEGGRGRGKDTPFSETHRENLSKSGKKKWENEEFKEKLSGKNSFFYGTNYYKIWIDKYGKEKADELNLIRSENISKKNKEHWLNENWKKDVVSSRKTHKTTLIEKYGKEEGIKKWNEWIENNGWKHMKGKNMHSIWSDKFGEEIANEKYSRVLEKRRATFADAFKNKLLDKNYSDEELLNIMKDREIFLEKRREQAKKRRERRINENTSLTQN